MKKAMPIFLAVAALFLWIAGTSSSGTIETGKTDDIEYMTGGVGIDERQQMEEMAKGYNLKAIFATTSGGYLSDIAITITKTSGGKSAGREEQWSLVLRKASAGHVFHQSPV